MSTQSFKVKSGLTLNPTDLTTLTNPQAGDLACDINDSNKIKRYDANSSAWTEVGSGGVGSVDIMFVQDFESASLSTFESPTDVVLSTTDPLHGRVSAILTHDASVNKSFKQIIPVDRKFRGQAIVLDLNIKSAASAGNVTIKITDESAPADLIASEQLQLSSDVSGRRSSVSFTIPSTCESLSYTITALPEAGSPVTRIDDIVAMLSDVSLLETSVEFQIPVVTEWTDYSMTIGASTTAPTKGVTSVDKAQWRRVGSDMEIRYDFKQTSAGSAGSGIYLFPIPSGYTIDNTKVPSGSADQAVVGVVKLSATTDAVGVTTALGQVLVSKTYPNRLGLNYTQSTVENTTWVSSAAYQLSGATIGYSFSVKVPIVGWTSTETTTKTIPLTQSGLVQEGDSYLRIGGFTPAYSSSNTRIHTLVSGSIQNSLGSDIIYADNATSGATFTAATAGIYNFSYSAELGSAVAGVGFSINSTQLSTDFSSINTASKLPTGFDVGSSGVNTVSTSVYLAVGDVIRLHGNSAFGAAAGPSYSSLVVTKQGSLKQISVSSDQKITIPTSELRFTGSSSRGTADSGTRVKFDTLASIRGDAFTVTNDATGTMLTVTKKGILSVNANLVTASATYAQIIVAGRPMSAFDISGNGGSGSWDGTVNIGDTIYVVAGLNPNGNLAISFNAILQEQDIAVSVTNTLPQFSESDSSVRVDTANGYGSTGTLTRRFSNVRDNIGTDIEYADSATNGASFTVRSAGIYNISYSDMFDSASNAYMGITKNASSLSTAVFSLAASERLALTYMDIAGANASCSWQGYLAVGDIIRAQVGAANATANPSRSTFTISKVGKPNVTGVDVTPFVNVPQPKTQSSLHVAGAITANSIVTSLTSFSAVDSGVYSVNTTTGIYTVLKPANFTISYSSSASGAASVTGVVVINSIDVAVDTTAPAANNFQNAVWTGLLNAGDTFWARSANNASSNQKIIVSATALSDQILTAPETFSTDTASLQYASSSLYNLTTLANAPVGTYITFTYAPNTNTRTQTTTPPSQSPADMNANGIQIFTRAYNAASTSGNPSAIAIQIGKGHKGFKIGAYTNTVGKITPANLDFYTSGANTEVGALIKDYSETTGILIIDAGYRSSVSNTTHVFIGSDQTNPNPIRLDVNASKNPALTGMNLERVSARAFNSAGTSIPSASNTTITYSGTTFDTHGAFNTSTGVFTAPETGYYQINGAIGFANFSWTASQIFDIYFLKNGITFATKRQVMPTISESSGTNLSDVVYLLKSDTVTMQVRHTRGTATTLEAGGTYNYLSIAKVNIGKGN